MSKKNALATRATGFSCVDTRASAEHLVTPKPRERIATSPRAHQIWLQCAARRAPGLRSRSAARGRGARAISHAFCRNAVQPRGVRRGRLLRGRAPRVHALFKKLGFVVALGRRESRAKSAPQTTRRSGRGRCARRAAPPSPRNKTPAASRRCSSRTARRARAWAATASTSSTPRLTTPRGWSSRRRSRWARRARRARAGGTAPTPRTSRCGARPASSRLSFCRRRAGHARGGPPRGRVAAPPRVPRGYSLETSRGAAAAATWILSGDEPRRRVRDRVAAAGAPAKRCRERGA